MVNRDVSATLRLKPTLGSDIVQSFNHMFKFKKAVKKRWKWICLTIDIITIVWIIQAMLFRNLLHCIPLSGLFVCFWQIGSMEPGWPGTFLCSPFWSQIHNLPQPPKYRDHRHHSCVSSDLTLRNLILYTEIMNQESLQVIIETQR